VLVASRGIREEWNHVDNSISHRVIPLPSAEAVARMPMISALIAQLELPPGILFGAPFVLPADEQVCNVFHVEDALASPFVPDKDSFVKPCGVRSVLGFGGVLPGDAVFATILFSATPIYRDTAELFRTVALSVRLALCQAPSGDSDLQEFQIAATENLLRRHERIALERYEELARLEAHARARAAGLDHQAERLRAELHQEKKLREAMERARRAEQSIRTRDEWLSVLSHELKSPISSILLLVQGILRGKDAPTPSIAAKLQTIQDRL
jgi:signal transduction histidine kinase